MRRVGRLFTACVGVIAAALVAAPLFGAGFQLYTEGSAEALGQAGAVSARRDVLSNAWYNPASMTDFARPQFMIGDALVRLKIDYDDKSGADWSLEHHWRPVPHFYTVYPFDEKVVGTLSCNVPYGLATDWPDSWSGRTTALDTRIEAYYLTPAVAWKMTDRLSLAVGMNVVRARAHIRKILPAIPLWGIPESEFQLSGEDYGVGYLAALNYMINEEWNVALKYQSRVDLTFEGDTMFSVQVPGVYKNGPAEADLRLPATVTLGISNRSIDKWTFGFDIVWTQWTAYDALQIRMDNPPGTQPPVEKDWRNVFSYRLGAEYQYNENWRFRCGYVFDESPIDGDTRAPEMPGSDRHMFMIGCSYDTERWGVDFAYSYLIARDTDAGNEVPIGGVAGGNYRTRTHLAAISFRYKF